MSIPAAHQGAFEGTFSRALAMHDPGYMHLTVYLRVPAAVSLARAAARARLSEVRFVVGPSLMFSCFPPFFTCCVSFCFSDAGWVHLEPRLHGDCREIVRGAFFGEVC